MDSQFRILLAGQNPEDIAEMRRELSRRCVEAAIVQVATRGAFLRALGQNVFDLVVITQDVRDATIAELRALADSDPAARQVLLLNDPAVASTPDRIRALAFHCAVSLTSHPSGPPGAHEPLLDVFDHVPVGMYRTTPAGRILAVNPAMSAMLGYDSPGELEQVGLTGDGYHPEYSREEFKRQVESATGVRGLESAWKRRDGTRIMVREHARAVRDGRGHVLYYDGMAEDITERVRDEESLRETSLKFQMVFEHANDGISLFEEAAVLEDRKLIDCNQRYAEMAGRPRSELLRVGVTKDIARQLTSPDWPTVREGVPWHGSFSWLRPDGKDNVVEYTAITVRIRGKKYTIGIDRDVTDRIRSDELLRASLREKDILLKEVHHRVKNNLQMVSSLLGLQARSVEDQRSKEFFRESIERIRVLAQVHERLYKSENIARIDFAAYLETVLDDLFKANARPEILCSLDADPVSFGVSNAIPCGLIVNELLSNAFKHAFPDGRQGRVQIGFHRADAATLELTVTDDGVGFPAGVDIHELSSMGMTVVVALVQQIGGTIELRRGQGTQFVIRFPE